MKKNKFPEVRFSSFGEEWEQRKLSELCDEFKSGKNIKAEHISDEGRYPVLGGNGLRGYTNTYNHDGLYALIGRQGALCGNMNISSGKAYFTEHAVAVKGNKNNETRFLFYLLGKMNLGQYSSQSAQPGLAVNKLIELTSFIPIYAEQEQISAFFKKIDDAITHQEQELTTLKQTKQGFLQKMFPKEGKSVPEVRFPGFTEDWEQRKLGDVTAEAYQGINTAADKVEYSGGGVEILQSKHITSGKISFDDIRYLDKERYSNYFPKYAPKIDDILFANIGTIGPSIVVNITKEFLVAWNIMKITLNENGSPIFIQTSIQRLNNKRYFESVTTGNATKFVNKDEMLRTPISLPNVEEQKKVGGFFQQLDDTIALHQQELDALQETKKAFLQKMFV